MATDVINSLCVHFFAVCMSARAGFLCVSGRFKARAPNMLARQQFLKIHRRSRTSRRARGSNLRRCETGRAIAIEAMASAPVLPGDGGLALYDCFVALDHVLALSAPTPPLPLRRPARRLERLVLPPLAYSPVDALEAGQICVKENVDVCVDGLIADWNECGLPPFEETLDSIPVHSSARSQSASACSTRATASSPRTRPGTMRFLRRATRSKYVSLCRASSTSSAITRCSSSVRR